MLAASGDRSNWRHVVRTGVRRAEAWREEQWHDKRERQRARVASAPSLPTPHTYSNYDTVTKTAFPELDLRVTVDAARQRTDISGAAHCFSRQTETTTFARGQITQMTTAMKTLHFLKPSLRLFWCVLIVEYDRVFLGLNQRRDGTYAKSRQRYKISMSCVDLRSCLRSVE